MITEKKLLTEQQLRIAIEEYNQVASKKEQLLTQVTELRGAVRVLQELEIAQSNPSPQPQPT